MFNGKMKAVTFSYDDGVTQDQRLIEILDKYGLKCTFNINSGRFGLPGHIYVDGKFAAHAKPPAEELPEIYVNHEVAVHTINHPTLTELSEEEIIYEVEEDRKILSKIMGYDVVGMAYPNGPNDDRVAEIIRNRTGVRYSRTTKSTYNFDLQDNLLRFNPTIRHGEMDKLFELGREFIDLKPDSPKIFYIWGHAYEFDAQRNWAKFEEFCKLISGRDDIFYGTNTEVLLAEHK